MQAKFRWPADGYIPNSCGIGRMLIASLHANGCVEMPALEVRNAVGVSATIDSRKC